MVFWVRGAIVADRCRTLGRLPKTQSGIGCNYRKPNPAAIAARRAAGPTKLSGHRGNTLVRQRSHRAGLSSSGPGNFSPGTRIAFLLLFSFGMLARYYPDIWMAF